MSDSKDMKLGWSKHSLKDVVQLWDSFGNTDNQLDAAISGFKN